MSKLSKASEIFNNEKLSSNYLFKSAAMELLRVTKCFLTNQWIHVCCLFSLDYYWQLQYLTVERQLSEMPHFYVNWGHSRSIQKLEVPESCCPICPTIQTISCHLRLWSLKSSITDMTFSGWRISNKKDINFNLVFIFL